MSNKLFRGMFVRVDNFFVEKHISCRDNLGVFKSRKYWAMPFQLVVSVIAQIRQPYAS